MHALISPAEPFNKGVRICEVQKVPFEVAKPLFWVECEEGLDHHNSYYDMKTEVISAVPPPVVGNFVQAKGGSGVIA